jgi:two-component system phosphate regulon sensor histidine kinase PhoR
LVLHDVTEMRRLEAVRRDFVANVSHELRTPVSVIRANAETLLDGALEDEKRARTFLDALVRNADRLSRILADLLDLSRLEAGRYALDLEPIALSPAVEKVVELVETRAKEKSIAVAIDVAPELAAHADARAFEQVLLNLIDNAVKYTPASGHILVSARRVEELIRVEVTDDGPGIEPRHRARLFERFYRVDPGRSRDVGGTGLGLAIVKHLVESMGGRVGMEPAAGAPHGSTFWVTLAARELSNPVESTAHSTLASGTPAR